MLSQANDKYPAYGFWMHIYVPEVDVIFMKAVEYGCEVVDHPTLKEGDPDKRGTFEILRGIFGLLPPGKTKENNGS